MSGCTVVILQSNYLPWKGYFQLVHEADHFVFYDDVQYTKNDWRNRNRVRTANGPRWITVPVLHAGRSGQRIDEARIDADRPWQRRHRMTIDQAYAATPHRDYALELLAPVFDREWHLLSDLNQWSIREIAAALEMRTQFHRSSDLSDPSDRSPSEADRTQRLVSICRGLGASEYLTGPAAGTYLDESLFADAAIAVRYAAYHHRPYPGGPGAFEHQVSIVDLLACCGPDALEFVVSHPDAAAD